MLNNLYFDWNISIYFGQEIYNVFVDNGVVQGEKAVTKQPW
ncbi:hypothetical protein [Agrilactobacillus fermenti]|nr:hypothetical protein [Agrilactobacillus fermenti]